MRPALAAALLALLVALGTADERAFGLIPDGQQMLSTAAAIAHGAGWGVSRDFAKGALRPAGDAVTRYGLAQPALETAPMLAARAVRAASAPFFVLMQCLLLAGTAAAAAAAASLLGAAPLAAALLGAATVLATPLLGYAASDFSEPLQALAVALALLFAARLASRKGSRAEIGLGLAAGLALLAKPLLLAVVAPLLVFGARAGSARRLALAFTPPALLFLVLEVARFGVPFAGYPGEHFDYPLAAGLWRLTLGPNKGLLVYAPLVLLAPLGLARLKPRALALAMAAGAAALLFAAASWWAWDGESGWGPRLLVPALPLLVVAAAPLSSRPLGRLAAALGAAGFAVNLLGALEPFPFVYALAALVPPQPIEEARAEGTRLNLSRGRDGTLLAAGDRHLALTPAWSPIRVHARLLLARLRGTGPELSDIDPPFVPRLPRPDPQGGVLEWTANPLVDPTRTAEAATSRFAWPFWGRSWVAALPGGQDPYALALRDQAIRALDTGAPARARAFAEELLARGSADPRDAALAAEGARRAGDDAASDALRARSGACHPWLLFVDVARGRPVTCLPPGANEGLTVSVERALADGVALPAWWRALRHGGGA